MKITITFNTINDEELINKVKNIESNEDYINLISDYNEETVIDALAAAGMINANGVSDIMKNLYFDDLANCGFYD